MLQTLARLSPRSGGSMLIFPASVLQISTCLGLFMEPERRVLEMVGCQVSLRGVSHRPVLLLCLTLL